MNLFKIKSFFPSMFYLFSSRQKFSSAILAFFLMFAFSTVVFSQEDSKSMLNQEKVGDELVTSVSSIAFTI